jgi:hypothetical protein
MVNIRVLGCVISFLSLPVPAHAQPSPLAPACIFGFVEDARRQPVGYARITLASPVLSGTRTTYSNPDGLFCVSNLPAVDMRLHAESNRLRLPTPVEVKLRHGFKVPLVLTLTGAETPGYALDPTSHQQADAALADCACYAELQAVFDSDLSRRGRKTHSR